MVHTGTATSFGLLASLLTASVQAGVVPVTKRALQPYSANVTVHDSCNGNETQSAMLNQGIADALQLASFSKQYVLANGAEDPLYVKWFGTGDYISVIGAYDGMLASNKRNVTIRCDNPDGNCAQEGWAGHWRGENATTETVICPLSFEIRQPLNQVCQNNHTVAGSPLNQMFGVDLLHRLWHVPSISDESVDHYADSYTDCTELAHHNATWAPFNTHTLQYFALEAYANEVAAPGEGCTGEPAPAEDDHSSGSVTASAPTACHTHSDGTEHCE